MILLDPRDRIAERPLQTRITREVAMHTVADAHELALDDALLGFAAGREQDLMIALHELLLGRRDRLHGEIQDVVQRLTDRQQHVVRRPAGEVENGHTEDDPKEDREAGIGSDLEKSLELHDWRPRCRRFPVRPVALRPFLSEGVPLAVARKHRPHAAPMSNESVEPAVRQREARARCSYVNVLCGSGRLPPPRSAPAARAARSDRSRPELRAAAFASGTTDRRTAAARSSAPSP